jgi:hypothetical protein
MRGYIAILVDDLSAMIRSWIVWSWLTLTLLAGISAVVVSLAYADATSFILAWGLVLYIGLGSFVVIIIAANAASGELTYLGDALMSRSLTPMQYVLAKLTSRLLTVLLLFLGVVVPVSFALIFQVDDNDLTRGGISLGLTYLGLVLALLVCFGVTLSTVISNGLLAMALAVIVWYLGLGGYAIGNARDFSPEGVLGVLPLLLRGQFSMAENWSVLGLLILIIGTLVGLSMVLFAKRDL